MKNQPQLGRVLANLRTSQSLSQRDLAEILGCDKEQIASWEAARTKPPRETLIRIAELVGATEQQINQMLDLAGYDGVEQISSVQFVPYDKNLAAVPVQIEDLRLSIESLTGKLGSTSEATAVREEIQNASLTLEKLMSTSRQISAPVSIPSQDSLTVRLVPVHMLDRLEEYRSDERRWLAVSGLFLGAIFAVIVNLATGGTLLLEGWVILGMLLLGFGVTLWSGLVSSKRALRMRDRLVEGEPTNVPYTVEANKGKG